MNVKDKVVIVTGAGMGLGRATALAFATRGASVMLADLNPEANEETRALIREGGGRAETATVDVTDDDGVKAMVERTVEIFGKLDVAVNNAGIDQPVKPFLEQDDETFRRVIDVNLRGLWLCMRHELAVMVPAGKGSIINVTSAADTMGNPMMPFYTASKHGALGLTRSAATELAPLGIRINAVSPGAMRTPMLAAVMERLTPEQARMQAVSAPAIGRVSDPEEVANAIVFLGSNEASYVIGHSLKVDGGMSVW